MINRATKIVAGYGWILPLPTPHTIWELMTYASFKSFDAIYTDTWSSWCAVYYCSTAGNLFRLIWLLGGMLSSRPRHLRIYLPAGASFDSKVAVRPPLPPPPPHRAHWVPCNFTRILNHRIEPTIATPAKSDPQAKFVCACFGGAIEVSKFSENRMTSLRKKLSKMLRWFLCCTDYTTNVTCCGNDNHAVVNYHGGNEEETRDDGRQGGGSHGGGSQQAVADLISL